MLTSENIRQNCSCFAFQSLFDFIPEWWIEVYSACSIIRRNNIAIASASACIWNGRYFHFMFPKIRLMFSCLCLPRSVILVCLNNHYLSFPCTYSQFIVLRPILLSSEGLHALCAFRPSEERAHSLSSIFEAELFLDALRFLVSAVIGAPYAFELQFLKGVAQQFPRCLRDKAASPVWNADPVTQLRLVILFRKVVMVQTDASYRKSCFFEYDGIGLRRLQNVPYDLAAVFRVGMDRPSGNGPEARVFCISIAFFRVRFFPRAENEPFCF